MKEELLELVKQAQAGDNQAFEQLLEEKKREIMYITSCYCRREDIEDKAQDAMLNMYRRITELKDPQLFQSWMYSIIKNTCRDYARRRLAQKRDMRLVSLDVVAEAGEDSGYGFNEMRKEFLPLDYVEHQEKKEVLAGAIEKLPGEYRECLLMFYYEELSYKEISAVMGINEKKVANNLLRAKSKLKKYLSSQAIDSAVFSAVPVGAIPVLTQFFRQEAQERISDSMIQNISRGIQQVVQSSAVSSTATGTVAADTIAKGAAAGSSIVGKVAAGVALTGLIGGAIVGNHLLNNRPPEPAPAEIVEEVTVTETPAITELPETPTATPTPTAEVEEAEEPEEPEVPVIETLEDMIGPDLTTTLAVYETASVSPEEWDAFVQESGLQVAKEGETSNEYYVVYLRQEQERQLVAVTRMAADGEVWDLRYQFGEIKPLETMLAYSFWF